MKRTAERMWRPSPNEEARLAREERERRRKQRLLQVREQQRVIAEQLRREVQERREAELQALAQTLQEEWQARQEAEAELLRRRYEDAVATLGHAHRCAQERVDDSEGVARRSAERRARADERHRQAMRQLAARRRQEQQLRSRPAETRRKALLEEKKRAERVAALPPPPPNPVEFIVKDPRRPPQTSHVVVDRESPTHQTDAREAAAAELRLGEERRQEEARLQQQMREAAQQRGSRALQKERQAQERERLLEDLERLQQADLLRRRQETARICPPPYRQEELRDQRQRALEFAFHDVIAQQRMADGDLVCPLAPEPLSALSSVSRDEDLDVTLDPTPEGEQPEAPTTPAPCHAESAEASGPQGAAGRQALRRLLERIRSQPRPDDQEKKAESESVSVVEVHDEEKVLSSERGEQMPSVTPAAAAAAEEEGEMPSAPGVTLTEEEEEEEEETSQAEVVAQLREQLCVLEELEHKRLELQRRWSEAPPDTRSLPEQPQTPQVQEEEEEEEEAEEDVNAQRLHQYQQRLLEQNRLHRKCVHDARQRLEDYQQTLKLRHAIQNAPRSHATKPDYQSGPVPLHHLPGETCEDVPQPQDHRSVLAPLPKPLPHFHAPDETSDDVPQPQDPRSVLAPLAHLRSPDVPQPQDHRSVLAPLRSPDVPQPQDHRSVLAPLAPLRSPDVPQPQDHRSVLAPLAHLRSPDVPQPQDPRSVLAPLAHLRSPDVPQPQDPRSVLALLPKPLPLSRAPGETSDDDVPLPHPSLVLELLRLRDYATRPQQNITSSSGRVPPDWSKQEVRQEPEQRVEPEEERQPVKATPPASRPPSRRSALGPVEPHQLSVIQEVDTPLDASLDTDQQSVSLPVLASDASPSQRSEVTGRASRMSWREALALDSPNQQHGSDSVSLPVLASDASLSQRSEVTGRASRMSWREALALDSPSSSSAGPQREAESRAGVSSCSISTGSFCSSGSSLAEGGGHVTPAQRYTRELSESLSGHASADTPGWSRLMEEEAADVSEEFLPLEPHPDIDSSSSSSSAVLATEPTRRPQRWRDTVKRIVSRVADRLSITRSSSAAHTQRSDESDISQLIALASDIDSSQLLDDSPARTGQMLDESSAVFLPLACEETQGDLLDVSETPRVPLQAEVWSDASMTPLKPEPSDSQNSGSSRGSSVGVDHMISRLLERAQVSEDTEGILEESVLSFISEPESDVTQEEQPQ